MINLRFDNLDGVLEIIYCLEFTWKFFKGENQLFGELFVKEDWGEAYFETDAHFIYSVNPSGQFPLFLRKLSDFPSLIWIWVQPSCPEWYKSLKRSWLRIKFMIWISFRLGLGIFLEKIQSISSFLCFQFSSIITQAFDLWWSCFCCFSIWKKITLNVLAIFVFLPFEDHCSNSMI